MVEKIEQKICDYFGVTKEELLCRTKHCYLERGFLWYVLHNDYNMSFNALAKHYNRNVRNIARQVSRIRYIATTQKEYEEHHKNLLV